MTDQQLRSFVLIAEKGSFGKAEATAFLSKQALKKQIDLLEREVGFLLFRRSQRGIALTPAGEEFYRGVREMLAEMEELRQRSQKLAFNEQIIRIEAPDHPRLLLENALIEFSRLYPKIKQQVILQRRDYLVDDILSFRADIAECIYRPDFLQRGVVCTKLFPMPYKCLISPIHPLATQKSVSIRNLSGNRVGLLEKNTKLAEQIVASCQDLSLETLSNNNIQDIYNLCYNQGIFISKAYYIGTMQPLIALPLETDIVPTAAVLYHEEPSLPVREFLKAIRSLYPTRDSASADDSILSAALDN